MFNEKHKLSTDLSTVIPQKTAIIVVIVHFGSTTSTTNLVDTLLSGTLLPQQLVVVDHDPLPYAHHDARVLCVRPSHNRGYIAGLRLGVRSSNAREDSLLVLMNNDSGVAGNFLRDIAVWWNEYGEHSVLAGSRMARVSAVTGKCSIDPSKQFHAFSPVEYIDGACLVVQQSFFEQISNVEQLFMYWEDVAISLKAVTLGGRVRHIPNLSFSHDDTVRPLSQQKLYYLVRNGAYILEQLPFPWGMYWVLKNNVRIVFHSLLPGVHHARVAHALRDSHTLL